MNGRFVLRLVFILLIQVVINYVCGMIFPNNALAAMLTSDVLVALVFAYIALPPELRKDFYKQEIFHKLALLYFAIFAGISLLFNVF